MSASPEALRNGIEILFVETATPITLDEKYIGHTTAQTNATDNSEEQSPYIPIQAGVSLPKVSRDRDGILNGDGDTLDCSWSPCEASSFNVRVGPEYSKKKCKAPSPPSLMDIVGVDFLKCGQRIDNIGSKVVLPHEWTHYDSPEKADKIKVPPLLIVNFQFPSEIPTSFMSLFSAGTENGPGFSVALYCRLAMATESAIMSSEQSVGGATQLLLDYLASFDSETATKTETDRFIGRLKLILNCKNLDSFGLPSFITMYNSKPVLLRSTVDLIHGDGYNEIDVNIHKMGNLAKQALQILYDRFHLMTVDFGFCVESREEEEMGETLLSCLTMNKIMVDEAVPFLGMPNQSNEQCD